MSFSGATVLLDLLDGYKVKVIQGISSVAYLASRIGVPWAGCRVVSAHGRNVDIVREVAENEGIFVLTGGNVKQICQTLTENGLGMVKICAGEKLSYPREKITAGYVKTLCQKNLTLLQFSICVMKTMVFLQSLVLVTICSLEVKYL